MSYGFGYYTRVFGISKYAFVELSSLDLFETTTYFFNFFYLRQSISLEFVKLTYEAKQVYQESDESSKVSRCNLVTFFLSMGH